jgi:excisionase family DNA binding protein
VRDVAEIGKCSEKTVRRWVAMGALKAIKRGNWMRIEAQDVLAFLRANRVGA